MKPTRVAILGALRVLRDGIRVSLEKAGDIEVVGEAAKVEQLGEDVFRRGTNPGLVLIGEKQQCLALLRDVTRLRPGAPVTVVLVQDEEQQLSDLIEAGARGVVSWTSSEEELLRTLRAVASGKLVIDWVAAREFLKRRSVASSDVTLSKADDLLTAREKEVLGFAAGGMRNRELAVRLGLSLSTVKTHMANILSKLGCRSRIEAILLGVERGWFPSQTNWLHGKTEQHHSPDVVKVKGGDSSLGSHLP